MDFYKKIRPKNKPKNESPKKGTNKNDPKNSPKMIHKMVQNEPWKRSKWVKFWPEISIFVVI